MKKVRLILLLATLLSFRGFAHEGHGVPGAIPPAPHGGVVKEAEHKDANIHEGKEEVELFFEVVYKGQDLKVYPLALLPGNTNTFTAVSAEKDLSKISLKVEFPRTKKTETLRFNVSADAISSALDAKGANRFVVHVAAEHSKEMKVAKIQVENK